MPIQFGSNLSSATANNTFLDKTVDDAKKGVFGLYKTLPSDPDAIADVQDKINENSDEINTLKSRVDVPGQAFYFGDPLTDGTWRIIMDGSDLKIQIRVSSVWTTKQAFSP